KKVSLPESRWITVLNTHKPIISQADFDAAQLRLKIRSYNSVKRGKTHLLTGLVFCGDCKAPMSTIRESESRTYLVCQTWRKYAGLKLCTSHCIREDDVINETAKKLRELAESRIDRKQLAEDIASELQKIGRTDKTAPAIRKNLETVKTARLSLYKDKAGGVISQKDYDDFSEALEREESEILNRLKMYEDKQDEKEIQKTVYETLNFEKITRESLIFFVNKILIGNDKNIIIEFSFSEP
ncbi:MAG: recombinase zinc beta ribbon domain-containing protein, partial [Bacillota bacterium]|nr:recombinase zinc beta ribbon domain-containing protein [Bacillota bacterium]